MKRIYYLIILFFISVGFVNAQETLSLPQNSILKNFSPFLTPRTNYRPGSIFRIDKNGISYFVEDIKGIKSFDSDEGTLTGRMAFTKDELLAVLNVETNEDYLMVIVEIKAALREYNEQSAVDRMLWDEDKAKDLVVDDSSKYYIIRETVATQEISYRISESDYSSLITGKSNFKKETPRGDDVIDFPYFITKKFEEPRRVFYLQQEIGRKPYGKK